MSDKIIILIRYIAFIPLALLTWVLAIIILLFLYKKEGDLAHEIGFWSSRVLGAPILSVIVGALVFPLERKVIPVVILSLFWISFTVFLFMVYGGYIIPFEK